MDPRESRPPGEGAAATATTDTPSLADLAEHARKLVEEADCQPPCDLVTWAQGYAAGYDAGRRAAAAPLLHQLAEDLVQLDRTELVDPARFRRSARINREIAEGRRHVQTVKQTRDWPRVRTPGGRRG